MGNQNEFLSSNIYIPSLWPLTMSLPAALCARVYRVTCSAACCRIRFDVCSLEKLFALRAFRKRFTCFTVWYYVFLLFFGFPVVSAQNHVRSARISSECSLCYYVTRSESFRFLSPTVFASSAHVRWINRVSKTSTTTVLSLRLLKHFEDVYTSYILIFQSSSWKNISMQYYAHYDE